MSSRDLLVELDDVTKVFEPFPLLLRVLVKSQVTSPVRALDAVDLELRRGEICAVVGPNGAGKTTMFRTIAGLSTVDRGAVRVAGLDPIADSREVRRRIGWMPGDARTLFLRQTCFQNLWFHGRLQAMGTDELRAAIPRTLEEVGLGHVVHHAGFSLSSGMKARLQLARALLHRPRLLLLDEPTGTVDPVAAYGLLEAIRGLARDHGIGVLLSSHRLEEIEALGSRMVLLDRGQVRFDGSLRELQSRFEVLVLDLEATTVARARELADRLGPHVREVRTSGRTVALEMPPDQHPGPLLARVPDLLDDVVHVRERPVPLRDLLGRVYEATPDTTS